MTLPNRRTAIGLLVLLAAAAAPFFLAHGFQRGTTAA